jgi:hypothetical protein
VGLVTRAYRSGVVCRLWWKDPVPVADSGGSRGRRPDSAESTRARPIPFGPPRRRQTRLEAVAGARKNGYGSGAVTGVFNRDRDFVESTMVNPFRRAASSMFAIMAVGKADLGYWGRRC